MNTQPIYKSPDGERLVRELYDEFLAGWPVPFTGLMIPTRYGDTFVLASGSESAPPLVLLHGSCSNSLTWGGDVVEYSRHFRVYAVDIIGEPGKSAPSRPDMQSDAYAEWLSDVFDGLGIRSGALVGYSLGGWLAVKFASSYPERVTKLALMAPGGIGPARISFTFKLIGYSLCGRWGKQQIKRLTAGDEELPEGPARFLEAVSRYFRPRMVIPQVADEELRQLTMPVFVVAGEKDLLLRTDKTVERMQSQVGNCALRIFPEAGHLLLEMWKEILPFLVG